MQRRTFLSLAAPLLAQSPAVEQWGLFETTLPGPSAGNPFVDVQLAARFRQPGAEYEVEGFYDGNGQYKVRFMPDRQGEWTYTTTSNDPQLNGRTGKFTTTAPGPNNHGPVRVHNTHHFQHADGTPHYSIGTTCYAWIHQGDKLEEQTLETLRTAPFNKMRMCIFPKSYTYNTNEPVYYAFENKTDFTRPNPAFFHHLERRVLALQTLGIQADLILFHPYDRWGYAHMGADADERYLRYTIARLAAFRNVWWSVANEYNFVRTRTLPEWDHLCRVIKARDPYNHLIGIHNGGSEADILYDHHKSWISHVSIQLKDLSQGRALRERYNKPVVYDECFYEGDLPRRWGDISGREMTHRFWLGTANGCYVGHGETYLDPNDVIWWSKGGVLKGESPKRIAFLKSILATAPAEGMMAFNSYYPSAGVEGKYFLHYLDIHRPRKHTFELPREGTYSVDIIDPWEMTINPLPKLIAGKAEIDLPGKPYLALRVRRA